jgi:hypothetical protein
VLYSTLYLVNNMAHPDQPNIRLTKDTKTAAKYEYGKFGLNESYEPFIRTDSDDIGVTQEISYVQSGASAGRVSTIKRYLTDHTVDAKARLMTFEYGDPLFPQYPTKISISLTTI